MGCFIVRDMHSPPLSLSSEVAIFTWKMRTVLNRMNFSFFRFCWVLFRFLHIFTWDRVNTWNKSFWLASLPKCVSYMFFSAKYWKEIREKIMQTVPPFFRRYLKNGEFQKLYECDGKNRYLFNMARFYFN